MAYFNEHALEMSIMELFQDEGYLYLCGDKIHRERSDVLLADDLKHERKGYEHDGEKREYRADREEESRVTGACEEIAEADNLADDEWRALDLQISASLTQNHNAKQRDAAELEYQKINRIRKLWERIRLGAHRG